MTNVGPLKFVPVDLKTQEDLCVRFSEDAFIESFGDANRFHEEDGKGGERYRVWLRNRLAEDPNSTVIVYAGSRIIGQVTSGRSKADPTTGYVNLYYLIPEERGKGHSKHLEAYAEARLKNLGFKKARLSVSPTNVRAIKFYEKYGWRDLGPRPGHPEVHLMEKQL
ncbi:MAG: GNAT family N-acetyltransferase [Bdellovibrionota bacterium]